MKLLLSLHNSPEVIINVNKFTRHLPGIYCKHLHHCVKKRRLLKYLLMPSNRPPRHKGNWPFLFSSVPGATGLKDVKIEVPPMVRSGDSALLTCNYELENNIPLETIKWYFGEDEFYHYSPADTPPWVSYDVRNITIDVSTFFAHSFARAQMEKSPTLTSFFPCLYILWNRYGWFMVDDARQLDLLGCCPGGFEPSSNELTPANRSLDFAIRHPN